MKQCSKCGRLLPLMDFQIRSVEKGTFRNRCVDCRREYDRAYYARNSEKYKEYRRRNQPIYQAKRRALLMEYLNSKACVDCGTTDPVVLELDHVYGQKDFNIGDKVCAYAWKRVLRELDKCEVRCANCHRRKTARDFKWFKGNFGV